MGVDGHERIRTIRVRPEWSAYDAKQNRTTLVFGDPTNAVNDPRRAFREYWNTKATGGGSRDAD
jgi:hypothetical protein